MAPLPRIPRAPDGDSDTRNHTHFDKRVIVGVYDATSNERDYQTSSKYFDGYVDPTTLALVATASPDPTPKHDQVYP
jgi:hypothetical protein